MRPVAAPAVTRFGGRVELRLGSSDEQSADYWALFYVGTDAPREGRMQVTTRPKVQVTSEADPEVPEWLLAFAVSVLRLAARSAPPWPRRLTRWRDDSSPEPAEG